MWLIDRVLTGLRGSCEEAGGIIEDLDRDWGATCRPLAASPATELADLKAGETIRGVADKFDVNPSTVQRIKHPFVVAA